MKPRLACADFTFPLLPHDQCLKLIAMLGLKGVDIGLFQNRSHLQPSTEFARLRNNARKLKRKLDDHGLQMADLFLIMGLGPESYAINHPSARHRRKARDWFLKTLDYGAECGGKHVTGIPGIHFPGRSQAASTALAADELNWRVEQIRPYRMVFAVEAHLGSIVPRPKSALKLLNRVPGLTLTLDYIHFTHAGIPDREVEPLIPFASHMHIRGGRKGRLQANFADNVVDYRRVYRLLEKAGYKGWLGLEYVWTEWERCNESDNLSETIRFRDLLKSLAK